MHSARAVRLTIAVLTSAAIAVPAAAVPEAVPDRLPVASEPLHRAQLIVTDAPATAPSVKTADGDVGDWIGAPSGIGGTGHLAVELFNLQAGTKITHVPYKGSSLAITDLIGGRVHIYFTSIPGSLQHVTAPFQLGQDLFAHA